MSWEIFKQNILRLSNSPDKIPDTDTVARTWAREYDAAIRRGFDTINGVTIKTGNVQLMEQLFKAALQKGLTSTGPYDLVGEMGKGVLAYWTGATLNEIPVPIVPAPGSVANVSVTTNIVTNIGQWTPALSEIDFQMSDEEIQGAEEDLQLAQEELEIYEAEGNEEAAETARELIRYQQSRINDGVNYSISEDGDKQFTSESVINSEVDPDLDIGLRIVEYARKDIGVVEDPLPPGKPANWGQRVSQMLKGVGFNAPAFWCAAAVSSWYKSAGAKSPNSASCDVWLAWAKRNGLFSTKPAVGAAVLYGSLADAHHIGIVESIEGGRVRTIEGNTSGGGFNRNGVGVFRKSANISKVVGFVLPVKK